jgi:hypothetical protein
MHYIVVLERNTARTRFSNLFTSECAMSIWISPIEEKYLFGTWLNFGRFIRKKNTQNHLVKRPSGKLRFGGIFAKNNS